MVRWILLRTRGLVMENKLFTSTGSYWLFILTNSCLRDILLFPVYFSQAGFVLESPMYYRTFQR